MIQCRMQVSAKDDVNISGIFRELLTQARYQLDAAAATATAQDDDDQDGGVGPNGGGGGGSGPHGQLRRRRVGSDGLQRLRAKRTSCHVS